MYPIPPGFSDRIDVRRIERRSRRLLGAGYLFAALMLAILALTWHAPPRVVWKEEAPQRIMHFELIERPAPPVEEPYLVPAHPPRPKSLRREIPGENLPAPGRIAGQLPFGKEEPYTLPREMERETVPLPGPDARLEPSFPKSPEFETRIERKLERHFSLEEEGITLNDIDSLGTFKGFVIQDPVDKRKAKGFFYIPQTIYGIPNRKFHLDEALLGLAEMVTYFTGIRQKIDPPISFSSPDLIRYPFIYITSASTMAFELGPSGIRNLGEYLRKGGFLIADNGSPWYDYSPAEASLLNILRQIAGKDGRFELIPADHPIFNCFFDLPAKLPDGAEHVVIPLERCLPANPWGRLLHIPELEDFRLWMSPRRESVCGLWFGERLAAVYLDKGYGHTWREGLNFYKYRDDKTETLHMAAEYLDKGYGHIQQKNFHSYQHESKRPILELGVNIAVFALIQRGGIAKQYVDYTAEGKVRQTDNQIKEKEQ